MITKRNFLTKILPDRHDLAQPRIVKIVLNVGVGRMSQQPHFEEKILPEIMRDLALVAGQKPAATRARKSVAGFKLRAGSIVGIRVTLRRARMQDFLIRLIRVALPRVRDFRGIDLRGIDERGNLSIGLRDIAVFPEINPETAKIDFGVEISIVSTARNREEAIRLYRVIGMPLKR